MGNVMFVFFFFNARDWIQDPTQCRQVLVYWTDASCIWLWNKNSPQILNYYQGILSQLIYLQGSVTQNMVWFLF